MKRLFLILITALMVAAGVEAKKMSDLKIYINPGHGGYTGNDRPIRIHPFEQNDTAGYWESKSNLYKGLHMYHILDSLGTKPYLSRTKNTEADDRDLSGIAAEANNLNVDLFFSIHSNAGESVNYPLMLYREQTLGVPRYQESVRLSSILWQNLHSNQIPVWSHNTERIAGDLTFYQNMWSGGLGVLRTLYVPGLLSEGSMHEHRPEAHRLMNDDMCWLEAWHFVRSIMEFYDTEDRFVTGNVAGVVYDNHNLREFVMPTNFTMLGRDKLAPLNGVFIELVDASGTTVQKRTTDNMYNGVFVFRNVAPGNYTLRTTYEGYYTTEKSVTVKANEVTYQDLPLDLKREFPLEIISYSPKTTSDDAGISCASTIDFEFNTDVDTEAFESAFSIVPAVEGYFTYSNSYTKVSFIPNLSLEPDTHYTVTVSTAAKHPDPIYSNPNLAAELKFEFDTRNRSRLELISNSPAQGDEVHLASPVLEFRFDNIISGTNLSDVISVTDSKGTKVNISSRNISYNKLSNNYGNVLYTLSGNLTENETYSVRLNTELRDRENLPLSQEVTYTFKAIDATKAAGDAEVVEDFESSQAMFKYNAEETTGIGSTLPNCIRSTERLLGSAAGKFSYKFTDFRGGDIVWDYIGEPIIYNKGDIVGLHINGDFSDHELLVGFTSGTDVKYASLGQLTYKGWTYKTAELDMLEDGYPYELSSVRLIQTSSPITQQGNFGIDNITRVSNGSNGIDIINIVDSNITASPVPATDRIYVKAPKAIQRLELINLAGAITGIADNSSSISVYSMPAGIYFLRVTCNGMEPTTLRVIVK